MMNKKTANKSIVKKSSRSIRKPISKRRNTLKSLPPSGTVPTRPTSRHPRCPRCGSRTVHLEQLQQELLATLSLHCLICGHHAFLGKPVVRLIRRPELPSSVALKKARSA